MSRVFIILGKFGDQLSVLPMIQYEYEKTGELPILMVAKEHEAIARRLPYCQVFVYHGDWQDLTGAVKLAKRKFDQVVVTQTHGKDYPIAQTMPSFQLDQWKRAGMLDKWDKLPLVLPRPAKAQALVNHYLKGKPTILYADHSQSSPFPFKDELAKLLHDNFGATHQIVRLSEIRVENPLDLLPLYDAADLLVTVETMHLHLSKATKTPVIALATDRPSYWHGSACSKHFRFYCRYGEFERRQDDLISAAKDALHKVKPVTVQTVRTEYPFGYNLSTIQQGGKYISAYRYHPNRSWKTKLVLDRQGESRVMTFPKELDEYSLEDMRLFEHQGALHGAYTVATAISGQFRCVQEYGRIEGFALVDRVRPNIMGNDFTGLQKNWLPISHDDRLFLLYGNRGGKQIINEVVNGSSVVVHESLAPTWAWGEIRGGSSPIPHGNHLLRFFHSRQDYPNKTLRYFIGAAVMENKPPFKTLRVSTKPIMAGDEQFTPGCFHYKQNCILTYGAVKAGNKFLVSAGKNDCQCVMLELEERHLNL